jgi:cytochrome c oxidase assembly protein subunit 11
MVLKLGVITLGMFAFGYALVPLYNAICAITGINVLAVGETENSTLGRYDPKNSQIDLTREVTVEFDANSRGVWSFKPAVNALVVHPGEMATVMYEFQNTQARTLAAQAIPSYAPKVMAQYFHKVECFCFNQYTLAPGEKKQWPVVFVVDPKMPNNVTTMTLSYTFFEVGAKTPPAPKGTGVAG